MKVGLFFGSFNPIHVGHLIIAQTMLDSTDLDQVWFVVSPQNPFKKSLNLLHEHDRYHMVELATNHNPGCPNQVTLQIHWPGYMINILTMSLY
jgi:nicotinate-nucleotide adenylyltransferase